MSTFQVRKIPTLKSNTNLTWIVDVRIANVSTSPVAMRAQMRQAEHVRFDRFLPGS